MSKKIIAQAIDLQAANQQDKALRLLQSLDVAFVKKRLQFLAPSEPFAADLYALMFDKNGQSNEQEEQASGHEGQKFPKKNQDQRNQKEEIDVAQQKATIQLPARVELSEGQRFLTLLAQFEQHGPQGVLVDFSKVRLAQIWALTGLAALARVEQKNAIKVDLGSLSRGARFAHALGLEDVMKGLACRPTEQKERSFPLMRIKQMNHIEQAAQMIARMMVHHDDDTRKTLNYVLVELLRNAVQHSQDALGGVVAAQLMDDPQSYPRAVIQVAVADAGVGIMHALQKTYPEITDAKQAIVKSLEPHVSGAFSSGATGSRYNAGMGLFFISELAKLTAGRLVIASRGATYALMGDPQGQDKHETYWFKPEGTGFLGTLVTFELPINEVKDHESLLETVRSRAMQRTPTQKRKGWLRFSEPGPDVKKWVVRFIAEDVTQAEKLAREELHSRITRRESVALDFRGMDLATQSFLHALLFETLRLAWALRVEVYAVNAVPAVVSGLKLVDAYAISA